MCVFNLHVLLSISVEGISEVEALLFDAVLGCFGFEGLLVLF